MGIKSVVYRSSGHGSLRVKTSSCEDLFVRRPKSVKIIDSTVRLHQAGTLPNDISIAFYLSSFLLHVSILF